MRLGSILGSLSIRGDGGPTRVGWTRDGRAVSVETIDQTLRLLDERRAELWRMTGPPRGRAVVVGRGRRIALTGPEDASRLLDIESGALVAQLDSTIDAVSHDGSRAMGRSSDGSLRVWNAVSGAEVSTLPVRPVKSVALSPDGRSALIDNQDPRDGVELWDLDEPHCLRAYDDQLFALLGRRAFTPDGRRVFCGNPDGVVGLWDLASGDRLWSRNVGTYEPRRFAFSGDGVLVLSSGSFGALKVWELDSGAEVRAIQAGPSRAAGNVGFSPDGREVLAACADTRFRRFSLSDGAELEVVAGQGDAEAVAFTADGSRVFLPRDERYVATFDAGGGGALDRDEGPVMPGVVDWPGSSAARLADGRELHWVQCDEDEDSQIWIEDPRSGGATRPIRGQTITIAVGWNTPLVLAKQWWRGPLVLLHAERGELARLDLHDHEPRCAGFSPDERAAVIATHAGLLVRIDIDVT
jgi:WD40 repeat protein